MSSIIIGLDMATINSGVAVFEDNNLIDHFNIIAGGSFNDRLAMIHNKLTETFNKYNSNISAVIIEDTLLNKFVPNLNTCKELIILQGLVIGLCIQFKLKYLNITATHWKAAIGIANGGGGRSAQKLRSINFVKDKYNIIVDDNQSDAICIALAGKSALGL